MEDAAQTATVGVCGLKYGRRSYPATCGAEEGAGRPVRARADRGVKAISLGVAQG
jgi:hypothetical protein